MNSVPPPAASAVAAGWIRLSLKRSLDINSVTGMCITKLEEGKGRT